MDLPTPYHLGGRYSVTGLSVGRTPDDPTVRDCAGCGGYVYQDDWHVAATVTERGGSDARHRFCSDDCQRSWLRFVTDAGGR